VAGEEVDRCSRGEEESKVGVASEGTEGRTERCWVFLLEGMESLGDSSPGCIAVEGIEFVLEEARHGQLGL
jgi:hypothetical protein